MVGDFLFALFRPRFWGMQEAYSDRWDRVINRIIDEDQVDRVGCYTAHVGSKEVWIGNYPYSYGVPYRISRAGVRPSRRTIRRLREYIDAKSVDEWEATK